ncbi:hypothetical protein [Planctomycetes bacterium Pan216]|uniref:hypothetical protein n=1 Tax=Kolteria novifilia TaxID=2527975 RepID=UPI00119D7BE2
MPSSKCACCVAVALMALSACGQGRETPKTVPVAGTVTYQGKPVMMGSIVFQPVTPSPGSPFRPAQGVLEMDGSYEVQSFAAGDGAVPGEYRVVITSTDGGPTPEEPERMITWLIPRKYGDAEKTPLTVTVSEHGANADAYNFVLED